MIEIFLVGERLMHFWEEDNSYKFKYCTGASKKASNHILDPCKINMAICWVGWAALIKLND